MPVPLVRVKRKREEACSEELIIEAPRLKKHGGLASALDSLSVVDGRKERLDRHRFRRVETLEAKLANNAARESDSAISQELVQRALALRQGFQRKRSREETSGTDSKKRNDGAVWAELKTTQILGERSNKRARSIEKPLDERKKSLSIDTITLEHQDDENKMEEGTVLVADDNKKLPSTTMQDDTESEKKKTNRVCNPAERRMDRAIFDLFKSEKSELKASIEELFHALDAGQPLGLGVNFCRPRDGTTALMATAWQGSIPEAQALLKRGADANRIDLFGNTAAALATNRGHTQLATLLLSPQGNSTPAPPIDLDAHTNEAVVILPEIETSDDFGYVYDIYAYQDQPATNSPLNAIDAISPRLSDQENDASPPDSAQRINSLSTLPTDALESDDENASTRCVASPAPRSHYNTHSRRSSMSPTQNAAWMTTSQHGNTPLVVGIDRPLKTALTAACIRPSSRRRRRPNDSSFDTSSISSLDIDFDFDNHEDADEDNDDENSSLDSNNEDYFANDYPDEEPTYGLNDDLRMSQEDDGNHSEDYDVLDDEDNNIHQSHMSSFRNRPVPDLFASSGFADATPLTPAGFRLLNQNRATAL